jgi:hypothetical protein
MPTVREVADRFGVTTTFLVLALEKLGYRGATPATVLSAATVARFESEYGAKVRAARPAPPSEPVCTSDVAPPRASTDRRKPHVMRIAHAKVTAVRDPSGVRVKILPDDPEPIHAIDAAGTREGDPWHGDVVPGAVHFYYGPMKSGPPAACGCVKVRAVLGDEFVPADDPGTAGQCPRCAAAVAEGRGSARRRTSAVRSGATNTCESKSTARWSSTTAACAASMPVRTALGRARLGNEALRTTSPRRRSATTE